VRSASDVWQENGNGREMLKRYGGAQAARTKEVVPAAATAENRQRVANSSSRRFFFDFPLIYTVMLLAMLCFSGLAAPAAIVTM
jgi:hypothetical protein